MLSNRKIVVLGLTVVALFLLSGATVSAAEPIPGVQPYEIKLVVDEQGGWAIPSLGGLDLGLDSKTFASVANTLGLQFQVPTLDPALVQMAVENDVQTLALIKEGDLHTVLVNNQPVTAVTLTDDALALVAGFVPELETLISGLNRTYVAVGVQFPADGAAIPLDLGARLGATAAAPASATTVDLGVTVSPEGELLSVGGMDPAQFGVALPMVDVSILQTLGMDRLDAKLTAGGMSVIANDVELATVSWDPAQVENLPAIYTKLTGAGLPAGADSVVEVATGWLMDSQINLTAYVADTPQEDSPHVALGRPLMVNLVGDSLSIEGFAVRTGFEPVIAQYQAKLGAIALAWDGDEGKLTPVIGDKVMPSVQLDAGFLDVVGGTFLGGAMDWSMISESLGMADVTVALGADGIEPDLSLLSYEPMSTRSAFMTTSNIKISRTTGEVAVLGTTLPLDFVEALTGLEITDIVRQQVGPFGGVDSLDVRLGPNGLALTLNGETATIAWDEQTRDNLIALAVDLLVGDREVTELPAGGLMQDPVNTLMAALKMADLAALQDAVGALNQGQVGFTVEFANEALPESSWAGTLAGLPPLLDLVAPAS